MDFLFLGGDVRQSGMKRCFAPILDFIHSEHTAG